jgi:hypothetical protein
MARFWPQPSGPGPVFPISASIVASVVSLKFIEQFGELEWFKDGPQGLKPNYLAIFTARLKRIPQGRKNLLGSR